MEIRLTTALQPIQPSKAVSSLLERLRPGENISAVVAAQLAEDSFLLKLSDGDEILRARSQLDLTPGQNLRLEVVKLGATPELKIVPADNPQTPDTPEAKAIQQAFRQFLPKQLQLGELATTLHEAITPKPAANTTALPEPLRNLVKSVLDTLPQKSGLVTPEGLKQAAEDSGLFLEARLAAEPDAAGQLAGRDLKGKLLALNEALKQLIGSVEAKPAQAPGSGTTPTPAQAAEKALAEKPMVAGAGETGPETTGPAKSQAPGTAVPSSPLADSAKPAANSPADALAGQLPVVTRSGATPEAASPEEPPAAPAGATKEPAEGESEVAPSLNKPGSQNQPVTTEAQTPAAQAKPAGAPAPTDENAEPNPAETPTGKAQPSGNAPADATGSKAPADAPAGVREQKAVAQLAGQLPLPEATKATIGARTEMAPPPSTAPAAPQATGEREVVVLGGQSEPPAARDMAARNAPPLPPQTGDNVDGGLNIKTLHQRTEGAIARIVLDQLASLPQAEGKPMVWQMEIPFTDDGRSDAAKLKVIRENSRDPQTDQAFWSVILELSPPGLGTIHSRINLCGGYVNTYFWTDEGATSNLIQDHLDLLAARLQQAGLQVGELNTLPGAPAESGATSTPATRLVDERA